MKFTRTSSYPLALGLLLLGLGLGQSSHRHLSGSAGLALLANLLGTGKPQYPTCSANSASQPACSLTVDQLATGNSVAGTSTRTATLLPSWINIPLARQGQVFYDAHFGAIFLSFLYTSIFFIQLPQGSEILLFTGNSATSDKFAKRFTSTAAQFALWARDVFDAGQDTANVQTSLTNVRARHLAVVQKCADAIAANGTLGLENTYANYTLQYPAFWAALAADLAASNIPAQFRAYPASYQSTIVGAAPINQFLMGMVQWTLAGLVGGYPGAVLIHDASPQDLVAFNHFFAVIGYALGIDDSYNVALQASLAENTQMYQDVLMTYFVPGMFQMTNYSKILTEVGGAALISQLIPIALPAVSGQTVVSVTMEALYIRVLKDFLGVPATNLEATSSPATAAYTALYENVLQPASLLPGFHAAFTVAANAVLEAQGIKTFGTNYSTDASIAQNVYV